MGYAEKERLTNPYVAAEKLLTLAYSREMFGNERFMLMGINRKGNIGSDKLAIIFTLN